MGVEEALSGGHRGDGEAEDNGFGCFPVTYCWRWGDTRKWDTGSSAKELEAGWKTVPTLRSNVKGDAVIPVMDVLFSFKVIAKVSGEQTETLINAIDSALKAA